MPKIVPKSIQTCFELVLGQIFRKFFLPSVPWRVEFSKIFKKKISNFQKCPKVFPKVSKHVLNVFWVKLFEKFLPSFPWKVESSKIFKKIKKSFKLPKMPKIVPKSIQTCFERVLGQTFRKIFAQFSMEVRVFENFQKNQKNCKIPKMPKIVPKSIQTCFELVLGQNFRNFFLPVFHGGSRLRRTSKKIRKVPKFQKCPKMLPKVSKRVLNMFWGKFFEKVHAQCSMEGRVFENFQKKKFQISKKAKSVPKCIQTCFEHVFGKIF